MSQLSGRLSKGFSAIIVMAHVCAAVSRSIFRVSLLFWLSFIHTKHLFALPLFVVHVVSCSFINILLLRVAYKLGNTFTMLPLSHNKYYSILFQGANQCAHIFAQCILLILFYLFMVIHRLAAMVIGYGNFKSVSLCIRRGVCTSCVIVSFKS